MFYPCERVSAALPTFCLPRTKQANQRGFERHDGSEAGFGQPLDYTTFNPPLFEQPACGFQDPVVSYFSQPCKHFGAFDFKVLRALLKGAAWGCRVLASGTAFARRRWFVRCYHELKVWLLCAACSRQGNALSSNVLC